MKPGGEICCDHRGGRHVEKFRAGIDRQPACAPIARETAAL
jgi:hypothetical protein